VHLYDHGYWPSNWFDFVASKWAHQDPDRKPSDIRDAIEPGMADSDGSRMLEHMNLAGIDFALILNVDWELGMNGQAVVSIDEVHRRYQQLVVEHPDRLAYFAGVDPRRPDALPILLRAFDEYSARGLKLYPPVGFYPYEDVVRPLLDACLERSRPVAIHTGGTLGLLRTRFANPLFIQDIQRQYPKLTVMIAHSGSDFWWEEALSVASNGYDTYLELSGWQHFAKRNEDVFVKRLHDAISSLGPHKLVFGSDHISGRKVRGSESYLQWADWFAALAATGRKYGLTFTTEQIEAILGGNASRMLQFRTDGN
jgi:predicted TIM-barrel fold metal-dependent hydrolase